MISPLQLPYVLDNSVISALHQAAALRQILELWPGRWHVPLAVREEAAAWKTEGLRVTAVLDDLHKRAVISYEPIDPRRDGVLIRSLSRALGQGEAETIAVAFRRRCGAALDDRAARRACERLDPPVPWVSIEGLLEYAVGDRLIARDEARAIWAATNIRDPNRPGP